MKAPMQSQQMACRETLPSSSLTPAASLLFDSLHKSGEEHHVPNIAENCAIEFEWKLTKKSVAAGAVQLQMAKEGVPWQHGPLTMPSAVKTSVMGVQVPSCAGYFI